MFPSDLTQSAKYYTKIKFAKYSRERPNKDRSNITDTGWVHLPIPTTLEDTNGFAYNTINLWGLEASAQAGTFLMNTAKSIWEGTNFSNATKMAQGLFNGEAISGAQGMLENVQSRDVAKYALLAPGKFDGINNFVSQATGMVKNPHMTAYFRGVDLRSFKLHWILAPRSQKESQEILRMVKKIKARIHPSYTPGMSNLILDYPDQCYVEFPNNEYLEGINKCSVTRITLDRGNNANPNFFDDGAPITWTLMMDFTENEILTREDYEKA